MLGRSGIRVVRDIDLNTISHILLDSGMWKRAGVTENDVKNVLVSACGRVIRVVARVIRVVGVVRVMYDG